MSALVDALQEARAALLNPALSESERAVVVKVIEGALALGESSEPEGRFADALKALELTEEALDMHVRADALAGMAPDDGDAHALDVARSALREVTP